MITKVGLTGKEKRLLKSVIRYNIKNLKKILDNDVEEDLTLYCIENEVPREKLNTYIEQRLELFEELEDYPQGIFSLDNDNLSIVKTILSNCFNTRKNREAKALVWRKLNILENLQIYTTLN